MEPNNIGLLTSYTEEERRFLKAQANELKDNNQPCELHTRTQHSIYRGRVIEADEGGVVFQQESGSRVSLPLSLVEKFVGVPTGWIQNQEIGSPRQQQGGRSRAAGAY